MPDKAHGGRRLIQRRHFECVICALLMWPLFFLGHPNTWRTTVCHDTYIYFTMIADCANNYHSLLEKPFNINLVMFLSVTSTTFLSRCQTQWQKYIVYSI